MAEDYGVGISVGCEHFAQPDSGLRQLLDGKTNVFDNGCRTAASQAGHGGQHLLAEFPQSSLLLRIRSEGEGEFRGYGGDAFRDGGHPRSEFFCRSRPCLDQNHAAFRADGLEELRDAGRLVDAPDTGAVNEFHGRNEVLLLEDLHGLTGQGDVGIGNHRQSLVLVVHYRVVGNVGNEGQRSFGTDDQVLDDVDRVAVIHEGVERIARCILDLVFAANTGLEFGIGMDRGGDGREAVEKCLAGMPESLAGGGISRVEDGSVGQDDADVRHRLVGVLGGAAAHAAGVVGSNAADHGGVDGGRVGPDLATVLSEVGIGAASADTRLKPDLAAFVEHFPMLPAVRYEYQHRVADSLAGQ